MPHAPHHDLVETWYRRAGSALKAHYNAARSLKALDRWYGGFAALLAAVAAALVGAALLAEGGVSRPILWTVAGLSIGAAALTGLHTFLGLGEQAERHRSVASRYSALARDMESMLHGAVPLDARTIASIRARLGVLDGEAPTLPRSARGASEAARPSAPVADPAPSGVPEAAPPRTNGAYAPVVGDPEPAPAHAD